MGVDFSSNRLPRGLGFCLFRVGSSKPRMNTNEHESWGTEKAYPQAICGRIGTIGKHRSNAPLPALRCRERESATVVVVRCGHLFLRGMYLLDHSCPFVSIRGLDQLPK